MFSPLQFRQNSSLPCLECLLKEGRSFEVVVVVGGGVVAAHAGRINVIEGSRNSNSGAEASGDASSSLCCWIDSRVSWNRQMQHGQLLLTLRLLLNLERQLGEGYPGVLHLDLLVLRFSNYDDHSQQFTVARRAIMT